MMDDTLFKKDMRGWHECKQKMKGGADEMYWTSMSTGTRHRGIAATCKSCDAMCAIKWDPRSKDLWPQLRTQWLSFCNIDIREWSHVTARFSWMRSQINFNRQACVDVPGSARTVCFDLYP